MTMKTVFLTLMTTRTPVAVARSLSFVPFAGRMDMAEQSPSLKSTLTPRAVVKARPIVITHQTHTVIAPATTAITFHATSTRAKRTMAKVLGTTTEKLSELEGLNFYLKVYCFSKLV